MTRAHSAWLKSDPKRSYIFTFFPGVERPEWDAMYYQCKDLHLEVKIPNSTEHKKAKVLWAMEEAKDIQWDGFSV